MKPFLLRASAWILFASIAFLAACAPQTTIQNRVTPTLISVTVPQGDVGPVVLQGRYFGDGEEGEALTEEGEAASYVIVGANIDGTDGVIVEPGLWTPTRITFAVPDNAGYGFVFVVVDGVMSNGLPANLP